MESLSIGGNAVELMIDDDPKRIIRFYPTDVEFAEAYFSLCSEFDKARQDIAAREIAMENEGLDEITLAERRVQLTKEAFDVLRAGIDNTFGPGTAQTVFGNRNNLTMAARFFRGVTPYVRRARESEIARYTHDVNSGVLE